MTHHYFTKKSKDFYKIKILTILEFNNDCCSISELNGYSKKELKQILSHIKFKYNNIDNQTNNLYYCKY